MLTRLTQGGICCLLILAGPEVLAQTDLIFPDPSHEIVVVAADSCSGDLPCGYIMPDSARLARMVLNELRLPYHRSLIKVTQCLRNLVGDSAGPNVIYLSAEEGGYARTGLTIIEPSGAQRYPDLHYVDLVLDSQRIADGELDIFSHELGHAMMSIVWPDRWKGWSAKQHVSMGITDNYTALSEGWGIHFQQLAWDQVERYRAVERNGWHFSKDMSQLWHSNLDTRVRLEGIRHNDFIHRKALPQVDTTGMTITDLIFLEHTSPLFDRCRLRNAQEMMASEGVAATIFYRMTTDTVLQNNYQDWTFYQPFLRHPAPTDLRPQDLFTPLENVILKFARVWQITKPAVDSASAPLIAMMKSWESLYPEDREELLTMFLATTVAKTVTDELGIISERAALVGTTGKYMEYRSLKAEYDTAFVRIRDDILADRRAIDDNVGPQLWVENREYSIPITIFFPEPTYPLWINLNTAGVFDLASFPGITTDQARQIIATRDSVGYFRSVEQAKDAGWR